MRFVQWILTAACAVAVAVLGLGAELAHANGIKTVYVDDNGVANQIGRRGCGKPNYNTIQDAVNDQTADRIIVCAGTYVEQVTVPRSVIIEGKIGAIIAAPKAIANPGMIVAFSGLQQSEFHGFTVTAANNMDTNLYAGIGVQHGATVKIYDNHITDINAAVPGYNYGYGIYVDQGQVTITSNIIENYANTGIMANAGGIPNSVLAAIIQNVVKGHTVSVASNGQIGIDLREGAAGVIAQNTVTGNQTPFDDSGFGILVNETEGTTVEANTVSANQFGMKVSQAQHATVVGNTVTNNIGNGIQIHKTIDSTVATNTATDNSGSGIALTGNKNDTTTNVIVDSNKVSGNHVDGIFIDTLMVANTVSNNAITTSGHLDIEDHNNIPLQNTYTMNTCTTSNPGGLCN